jgi:monofunctional biosynthetic peptidoglycan transglycosylase
MPVAVMASEDSRFLLHHGFDFDAIGNAAKRNIKGEGGKKYGASTISQQTAKNVFLWPGRSWVAQRL